MAERARDLQATGLAVQTSGATTLLERMTLSRATQMQQFARSLPQDQQQLLFELYSQPKYLGSLDEQKIDSEWKKTLHDWRVEAGKEEAERVSLRLRELDAKLHKTPEEEAEQDRLLRQIVQLTGF